MRRSLAPSQILKPKEPSDISKQSNAGDKNASSEDGMVTIQRLPLFGFLEIPQALSKQFKIPSGCVLTEKYEHIFSLASTVRSLTFDIFHSQGPCIAQDQATGWPQAVPHRKARRLRKCARKAHRVFARRRGRGERRRRHAYVGFKPSTLRTSGAVVAPRRAGEQGGGDPAAGVQVAAAPEGGRAVPVRVHHGPSRFRGRGEQCMYCLLFMRYFDCWAASAVL
jgi:hypothetical protein